MHSKLTYTLIFIAIIIAGGFFYFFNNTQMPGVVGNDNNNTGTVASSTQYKNTQYGFSVSLPKSWEGYSVVSDSWEGYSLIDNGSGQEATETGPFISVRNPKWTEENPYQDIPIYVFTLKQWADINTDVFHIGAAPIGPSELARNANYVFALPARYNFAYPTGFEEVDMIIQSGAIRSL